MSKPRKLRYRAAAVGLAVLGTAVAAFAQHRPDDLNTTSGARLPYLTRADMGAEGQGLADIFARDGKPTDPITGPLAFAAYNVPAANALLDLHNAAVGKGSLEPHARELAIMVACRETNYTLEWNGHEKAALNAGVTSDVLDVIRHGKALTGLSDDDALVIRFGRELLGDKHVSSSTFAAVVDRFGEHGAMDMVAVMSTYAVSGFFAIAVDEHPPGETMLEPMAH